MSNLDFVARQIFETLSRPENKALWHKQPDNIKDIFRGYAEPGSVFFHNGINMVFKINDKGQLVTWKVEKPYQIHRINQEYGKNYRVYV